MTLETNTDEPATRERMNALPGCLPISVWEEGVLGRTNASSHDKLTLLKYLNNIDIMYQRKFHN